MPLHEVVVRGSYSGQECINRYTYRSSGTPASVTLSFGLVAAMGYVQGAAAISFAADSLAQDLREAIHPEFTYVDILSKNVYDPTDFYTTAFNSGTVGGDNNAGESGSPAIAYGFRSSRSRLDIRRGFKRYVGVSEERINNGGNIGPMFMTDVLDVVAGRLGDTITYDDEGNTLQYEPVIVSKEKYTTPSGNSAYRYYETEAEQLENVANAGVWQPYSQVRTQVSRQYGRGR